MQMTTTVTHGIATSVTLGASPHRRLTAAIIVAALALGVSGCGLNSFTSGLSGNAMTTGSTPAAQSDNVDKDQLLAAARGEAAPATGFGKSTPGGCPRVQIQENNNQITIYQPGRIGDGLAVVHRGELSKTARECQINGGAITVKYGFSGRVLLGPKGRSGLVSLPIRVALLDAQRATLHTEAIKLETAVTIDRPIGYFSTVKLLTFELPIGSRPGEFEILVGFERAQPAGAGYQVSNEFSNRL